MARRAARIFAWEVAWSNPNKPRPEGMPEIVLRIERTQPPGAGAGAMPDEILECWEEMRDYGYAVRAATEPIERRQLPLATKQRIRRRNLWKRLLKRYPLYVSDFYADQVAANPDRYGDYIAGEFADVVFAKTTAGQLKMIREGAPT